MVGVDDSSIQADSQHKSVDLVSAGSQPVFYIHQMNWMNSRNNFMNISMYYY